LAAVVIVVCLVLGGLIFGIVYSVQRKAPATLILLSLDGFRYDYLARGYTPNLQIIGKMIVIMRGIHEGERAVIMVELEENFELECDHL